MLRGTRQHVCQIELHAQFATGFIVTLQDVIACHLSDIEIHNTHIIRHSFHLSVCQLGVQNAVVIGCRSKVKFTLSIIEERELHR